MTNILDHNYVILRFNYAIIFFISIIILYFFIATLFKIFKDRTDFNNILDITKNICVKFDYNGLILNYNENFKALTNYSSENLVGYDIFKLIAIEKSDELLLTLFNDNNTDKQKTYDCDVICKNDEVKTIRFSGIENTNFFGAGIEYILVGTDITAIKKSETEYLHNKSLLESLTSEFRYAEQELRRNTQQIRDTQNEIAEMKERHKIFIDSIPMGVSEYDFNTRNIAFSAELMKYFIPNANSSQIHADEALTVFYNFIKKDSLYDLQESIYNALTKNTINFTTVATLTNGIKLRFRFTIIYKDNDPSYMFITTQFK